MAYTTGSAANFSAVKTALVNACTSDGWTENTDAEGKTVLSKSGMYVRLEFVSYSDSNFADGTRDVLEVLGRTGVDTGDTPEKVSIGDWRTNKDVDSQNTMYPVDFPVDYFIFIFTNEVFLVIGYNNRYQFLSFGQSDQAGLPGTGNWIAGSFGGNTYRRNHPYITSDQGGAGSALPSMALFWNTDTSSDKAGWLHHQLDTENPWSLAPDGNETVGIRYLTELIDTQPNAFNGESVLLPVRVYVNRSDDKISQVCELKNARHMRIDNYNPEEILTLGPDQWMVFPYHKKNREDRNGGTDDTGTFGWAIKYEGS